MHLSKLILNPRSKQARADLASPYQLHATLCWAFRKAERPTVGYTSSEQSVTGGERRRTVEPFLWRLEQGKAPQVLVQSGSQPDWNTLIQRFPDYFAQEPEAKLVPLEHLCVGQALRFRLRCNPTVTTLAKDGSGKKKRYGLYKLEDLLGEEKEGVWYPGWLERQAEKSGFGLKSFTVVRSEKMNVYKHDRQTKITLQSVLYEGHLKITDLETFKHTLRDGLGHAKALGFGLLSIARTPSPTGRG